MADIYARIKLKRIEKGLSQQKLAELVGYNDKTAIAHIEAGRIDLPQSKILAFAEALDTTTSYLLDGYEEENTSTEEALAFYYKYLTASKKTRRIIDQLLEEDD